MTFDHAEYQREKYNSRKEKYISILGGQCIVCESISDLEFDHIDPTTKEYNITTLLSKYSDDIIKKELDKCQLLCKECHRKKSIKEAKSRTPWNYGTKKEHGSYYGVYTLKCKCQECSEYLTKRKQKRAAVTQRTE